MGVYYRCSDCASILHLSPQSPGFGRMTLDCFVCGGRARYLPSGPSPGDRVVNAPEGPVSEGWRSVARVKAAEAAMSPTVPVQTPAALLELDAEENARTVAAEGLSNADLDDWLEGDAQARGEGADVLDDEDAIPTRSVKGLSDSDYVRLDEPMTAGTHNDPEENIPTRAVQGLAGRPSLVMGDDPPVDEPDEDVIPTRAVEGLADREVVQLDHTMLSESPMDLEEEIPTRAVQGLADRDIVRAEELERAAQEDIEEEIPTRAVEGLADRDVVHLEQSLEPEGGSMAGDIEEEIPTRAVEEIGRAHV